MSTIRLKCLQECFIPFAVLNADWMGDKRYPEQAIQRFISSNREVFSFLGISAKIDEMDYAKGLRFASSNFVGAAPLRKPFTGKYYTDIHITPRFGENISEFAYLLRDTLEPEYMDKELQQPTLLRAPFYFECINYFHAFFKAIPEAWHKFDTLTKIEPHPCSTTNWSKYVQNAINPHHVLKFENRKNELSRKHRLWQELTYTLQLALDEFESPRTPLAIKLRYHAEVSVLKRYMNENISVKPSTLFHIHSFDPVRIKELKVCANRLLLYNTANHKAWRMDSAELFERYVQYVFKQTAQFIGAHCMSNYRFSIKGTHHPTWSLRYLEPDIILHKDESLYFADAKYKAHMINIHSTSDALKDAFRSDLHQVLAYGSFDSSKNKTALLVYPANKFKQIQLDVANPLTQVCNHVFLIGLPFTTVELNTLVSQLSDVLRGSIDS